MIKSGTVQNGAEFGEPSDDYNKSPCREGRPRLLKEKTHRPTTPYQTNYWRCWKGMPFAKLPCENRQYNYQIYWTQFYQGNNFYNNYNKNIIIKIVTLVKLFAKANWCRRSQHRAHQNRTPPC